MSNTFKMGDGSGEDLFGGNAEGQKPPTARHGEERLVPRPKIGEDMTACEAAFVGPLAEMWATLESNLPGGMQPGDRIRVEVVRD